MTTQNPKPPATDLKTTMNAMVYERYGSPDVLELREIDKPVAEANEVLVRVHAAGIAAGDHHLLNADIFAVRLYQGLFGPKRNVLGHDFAGTVEAIGPDVTRFRVGDAVFGESSEAGCFAEYVAVAEDHVVAKPDSLSFEQASAVPVSAITALQGMRDKGRVRAGQRVLVNGASGGVGQFAVQIAKSMGAHVTGVCSTGKVAMVRDLGADSVIDYHEADFTQRAERYDLVLDCVGNRPLADCKRTLNPDGIYVAVAGAPMRSLRIAITGGKQAVVFIAKPNVPDLEVIRELIESGKVKPVLDRQFALRELPDAMRAFQGGQAHGKLVISMQS